MSNFELLILSFTFVLMIAGVNIAMSVKNRALGIAWLLGVIGYLGFMLTIVVPGLVYQGS